MNFRLIAILFITITLLISCSNKESKNETEDFNSTTFQNKYLGQGHKISEESFLAMRLNIMRAMGEKGITGAAEYCNLEALSITDSLSKAFDSEIKRTTLKLRNPKNEPTAKERELLEYFESLHSTGIQPADSLIRLSDKEVLYVRPIFTQVICQNCHGMLGNSLSEDNYSVIKKLYPDDKAIDYKSGDLRGMWSIKMKAKSAVKSNKE